MLLFIMPIEESLLYLKDIIDESQKYLARNERAVPTINVFPVGLGEIHLSLYDRISIMAGNKPLRERQ
jgi:hypothetical protein